MDEKSLPSPKRTKLEEGVDVQDEEESELEDEMDDDHCSICLQLFTDRAILPDCAHEFCFECIIKWTEQSRRCPLCTRTIGSYVIHHVRSKYDFQKHHLAPLRSSPPPIRPLQRLGRRRNNARPREWGRRNPSSNDVADAFERAVDKRRWVYQNQLYAKHVASNSFTRYRPCPSPEQFSKSPDLISRATIFIRRELQVWVNLDVEFLTTFIISLLKAIDIRSESSVKLLAEFLDMDKSYNEHLHFPNAEHFAHELYSYLRSPFKSLSAYDAYVQYGNPAATSSRDERRLRDGFAQQQHRPRAPTAKHEDPAELRCMETERVESGHASPSSTPETIQSPREVVRQSPKEAELHALHGRTRATMQRQEPASPFPEDQVSNSEVNGVDRKGKGRTRDPGNDLNGELSDSGTKSIEHILPHSVTIHRPNSAIPKAETSDAVSTGNPVEAPTLATTSSNKFNTNEGESSGSQQPKKSPPKPVRIRRPLLLAQAHLSKAGTMSRIAEDTSLASSNVKSEGRSLLSRISSSGVDHVYDSEPRLENAVAIDHSAPSSASDVDRCNFSASSGSTQSGGVASVRDKLRQRLQKEKAELVVASPRPLAMEEGRSCTTTTSNGDVQADDLAAAAEHKLRAQARLRTKLANERRQVVGLDVNLDQNSGTQGEDVGRSNENPSFVGMDAGLQETGREASLKELLERRRKLQP